MDPKGSIYIYMDPYGYLWIHREIYIYIHTSIGMDPYMDIYIYMDPSGYPPTPAIGRGSACQEQRFSFFFVRGQRFGTACLGCSLVLKVSRRPLQRQHCLQPFGGSISFVQGLWWQHRIPPGLFAPVYRAPFDLFFLASESNVRH